MSLFGNIFLTNAFQLPLDHLKIMPVFDFALSFPLYLFQTGEVQLHISFVFASAWAMLSCSLPRVDPSLPCDSQAVWKNKSHKQSHFNQQTQEEYTPLRA